MIEKDKLHNLIVNNQDLEKLESEINIFNPFSILKIEDFEIRHSNVLAWLLDPSGNHNLGDFFLKKVIEQIILDDNGIVDERIDLIDIHLGDFNDALVRREENDIDILLISKRNKFLLIIENKIHSKESKNQLSKYLSYAQKNYNDDEETKYKILPVLLTKFGDEPENNSNYIVFSHEKIYELIRDTLILKEGTLRNDVFDFIKFYLNSLKKVLNMDDKTIDLCLKIYDEHKDAIDLINKALEEKKISFKIPFKKFIEKNENLDNFGLTNRTMKFLPKELIDMFPKNFKNNYKIPYPLVFWISKSGTNRMKFGIEILRFAQDEKRKEFIAFLETKGYKLGKTGKFYTRVFTKYESIKDSSDEENITKAMENLYMDCQEEIKKITETIKNYEF